MLLTRESVPPQKGPVIMSIAGISGVSVGATTTGSAVKFRWPGNFRLVSWLMLARSESLSIAAQMTLAIQDETGTQLIFDGQGLNTTQSNFAASLELAGIAPMFPTITGVTWAPQWTPFTRIVKAGDIWVFQVRNNGNGAVVPFLGFQLETFVTEVRS